MIMTNKLLPVALIAALVGGSVGALVMHKSQPATAETTTAAAQNTAKTAAPTAQPVSENEMVPAEFNTAGEQTAYKTRICRRFRSSLREPPERDNFSHAHVASRLSKRRSQQQQSFVQPRLLQL